MIRQRRSVAPAIVQLADQIEADILQRGLAPGDGYLNAAETAKMLKVGTASANRALQLLEHRQVLIRRQRRGTYISNRPVHAGSAVRRINLIVDQSYLKTEGLLADGVLVGIQSVLPQADLRFRFMPVTDDPEFVHQMIDEALQSSEREGFVLVRASLTVQKLVAQSGLPAVIHGTPYPSVKSIPWIDRDVVQTGNLLTEYLLSRNCRHLLVLLRQQVLPGDHALLDTVQQHLDQAGPQFTLTLRCLPAAEEEVEAEVLSLMSKRKGKWGLICRSEPLAMGANAALQKWNIQHKRSGGEIVLSDVYRSNTKDVPDWVHTQLLLSPQEIGVRIGELLRDQFSGVVLSQTDDKIPVALVNAAPSSRKSPGRSETHSPRTTRQPRLRRDT